MKAPLKPACHAGSHKNPKQVEAKELKTQSSRTSEATRKMLPVAPRNSDAWDARSHGDMRGGVKGESMQSRRRKGKKWRRRKRKRSCHLSRSLRGSPGIPEIERRGRRGAMHKGCHENWVSQQAALDAFCNSLSNDTGKSPGWRKEVLLNAAI